MIMYNVNPSKQNNKYATNGNSNKAISVENIIVNILFSTLVKYSINSITLLIIPIYYSLKCILSVYKVCLLYTSPSPRDRQKSRMPSSA